MVSSSTFKREDVGANNLNKSSVQLVSGPKPLVKHRFYLDVKNHITSSKLEAKIKELGGLLELFLVREVTHVVTDKEVWATTSKGGGTHPWTPQPPSNQSSVYNDHGTPDRNTPQKGRPKTRADAMLERARKTPTVSTKDPLEQAKNWGITIWTLEKIFAWLEKVSTSITNKKPKAKVKELKAPYVKYEAFDRKHRPVFLEIRNWPRFNIKGEPGSTGLVHKSAEQNNMTRKSRAPQPPHVKVPTTVAAAPQQGYCEVCRAEYPRLDEHLESKKHLQFVRDNANFLELDSLINDGTNIESFLKVNVTLNDDKCNGLDSRNCSPLTHKMPRTRTSSICDRLKSTPLSPTGSDSGHRLRSRRSAMTNSYIGMTADDDIPVKPEGARQVRELRSTHRNALLKLAEQESDTWSSGRPKRACIRQKRISVDDNVISENKGFYKVESMKLRNNSHREERVETPVPISPDEKSIIVKFKRMRTSELKRLNNEAENFLFPKKDETSSEEDIDGDGPDTTISTGKAESSMLISSDNEDHEAEDERSMDSISSNCSTVKKKRRTHAEAFILDNKKYYKFETPGSRLRYHGSFMADIPMKSPRSNGDVSTKEVKKKEHPKTKQEPAEKVEEESFNLNDLKFSFEQIPRSEPWYQTFSRQDQGDMYYTCFSDSGYWKPFLLPYEMGPIPPLDPKLCILAYSQTKKQILSDLSSGSNSAGSSTPDPCLIESNTPESHEETSKASEDSITEPFEEQKEECAEHSRSKRRSRSIVTSSGSKNPRKSPRQHASTLAILSSLIQQRKKRELNRSKNLAERSLEAIPETDVNLEQGHNSEDVEELAKSIDDMLNGALEEFQSSKFDISCKKENLLTTQYRVDAIKMLEKYETGQTGALLQKEPKKTVGRKPGRKKRNRTGWPNKNNRRLKKEVVLEDADESTIDSLSVNAGSENLNHNEEGSSNLTDDDVANKLGVTKLNDGYGSQFVQFVNKNNQSVDKGVYKNSETNVQNSEDRVNNKKDNCRSDRVVDLDRWENAEKVLAAKISNDVNTDLQFQPYVRVQKLDEVGIKSVNRRLRNSSSPHRTNIKRQRRMPASPKSPRVLRKPRGRWYRER